MRAIGKRKISRKAWRCIMYSVCITVIISLIMGMNRYYVARNVTKRDTKQSLLDSTLNWKNDRQEMKEGSNANIDENLDIHFHYILYLNSMIPSISEIEYLSTG